MPILNFSIRSQEVDNNNDVNTSTRITQKTFKLQNTYKMKYLKLLHIYHNISLENISDGEGTQQNSILFAKISFLNSQNTVFYEHKNGEVFEHGGMICLGETSKSQGESVFKELYKVLHDGKQLLFINVFFSNRVEMLFIELHLNELFCTDVINFGKEFLEKVISKSSEFKSKTLLVFSSKDSAKASFISAILTPFLKIDCF